MKFDKGLMAGSGTMLVLALLENEDMYGYQIIEELARRSNDVFEMKEGPYTPSSTLWRKRSALPPTGRRPPRAGSGSTTT